MWRGIRPRIAIVALCLTIAILGAQLIAQTRDTASVFGTVMDAQTAVIPGASITLTNVDTGRARTAITNETGAYLFSLLPVGKYGIVVEQSGFRRYEGTGILLQANENRKVDVVLELGELTETISVEATPLQVDVRSPTLTETVDRRRVAELPLDGRNPADLALLTAGVTSGTGNNTGDSPERGRRPRGTKQLTVNGSRNNNLRYTLDGGDNNDNLSRYNLPFPFPDAVQEFSVQSATMGADQGNSSAGSVNIVTKSGTNDVHGNVFWFGRNTIFNATNFFSRQEDQLKRNQLGGTIGGPLVKNRFFGFFGYQRSWFRTAAGDSKAQTLTAGERQGDFSGNPITIHDPLTGDPFPNNVIPQNRLSPAGQNILKTSPLPDPDGFTRFSFADPENGLSIIGRADYILNEEHNLMFRYFRDDQSRPFKTSSPDNIHAIQAASFTDTDSATFSHNFMLSPTLIAHTQVTGTHLSTGRTSDFTQTFRDFGVDLNPKGTMISVSMPNSGVNIESPWTGKFGRATQEFVHDWTSTRGNHTFTWGVQYSWRQYNEDIDWRAGGHFSFNGIVTGFDRADFMLGRFSFFTQNNGELENRRQFTQGYHVSDTWRLKPNFTLTLGLRYEPFRFFSDELNRIQTFDLASFQQGVRTAQFDNAPPGLFFPGDQRPDGGTFSENLMKSDNNNLAPRIGIAWDPTGTGKTSVRAGYGIYYDGVPLWALNNYNLVAPFSFSAEFNEGILETPFLGREDQNRFPQTEIRRDSPFAAPLFTMVVDNKFVSSYAQNWHVTVERELFRDTRLRVGYVGSKGANLLGEFDQNAPIYNPNLTFAENRADIDSRRPLRGFQNIIRMFFGLNSNYTALQVSLNKQYSSGFTVLTTYTWSKTIDYLSFNGFGGGLTVDNPFNFFASRGLASQDRPHRFVSSFVWDLPGSSSDGPSALRAITRDWRVSGIVTLQSGRPFDIGATGDRLAGGGRARADLIGTGNPVLDTGRSKGAKIAAYFDTSRFQNPAPNTFGTLGRNSLRGPGFANFDLTVVRAFPIPPFGEAGRAELRFEAFNIFNSTHLANPVTGLTNPRFGEITRTDGEPRILQFGLKFFF